MTLPVWWTSRTPREQALLGVAAALAVGLFLWLGVWRPLSAAEDAAADRYDRAAAVERRVEAATARIAALRKAARPPPEPMAPAAALTQAGQEAGIAFSRMEDDPEGGVHAVIDSVAPGMLFPWLAQLQRQHGVAAQHLTVVKTDDGQLSVEGVFAGPADAR